MSVLLAILMYLSAWSLTAPAPAAAAGAADWVHVWEVVQLVQAKRPAGPVVYYLGDSAVRESTVSEASWTRQLNLRAEAAGKPAGIVAYTLGGHNQTFGMDATILRELPPTPEGQPKAIVFIGVGITRFLGPPTAIDSAKVAPLLSKPPYLSAWRQHHYDSRKILSPARKRALATQWMARHWTAFKRYRSRNLSRLHQLITVCQSKNFEPVLIEQPLNTSACGSSLRKPCSSYRSGCRALAKDHHIRYISLLRALALPTTCFYDIYHLVKPGYRRWQSRMTAEAVKLIAQP